MQYYIQIVYWVFIFCAVQLCVPQFFFSSFCFISFCLAFASFVPIWSNIHTHKMKITIITRDFAMQPNAQRQQQLQQRQQQHQCRENLNRETKKNEIIVVHFCARSHLAKSAWERRRGEAHSDRVHKIASTRKKSVLFVNMAKVHKSSILLVFMPNGRINQLKLDVCVSECFYFQTHIVHIRFIVWKLCCCV